MLLMIDASNAKLRLVPIEDFWCSHLTEEKLHADKIRYFVLFTKILGLYPQVELSLVHDLPSQYQLKGLVPIDPLILFHQQFLNVWKIFNMLSPVSGEIFF